VTGHGGAAVIRLVGHVQPVSARDAVRWSNPSDSNQSQAGTRAKGAEVNKWPKAAQHQKQLCDRVSALTSAGEVSALNPRFVSLSGTITQELHKPLSETLTG